MTRKTLNAMSTPEMMNDSQLEQAWRKVNDEKKNLAEVESLLRVELAKRAFGYNPDMLPTGTKRVSSTVDPSMDIVATFKVNTTVAQELVPSVLNLLGQMGIPDAITNDVFKKQRYEVSATGLKTLGKVSFEALQVVENILTRSSGMPQVTVEAAKAKKR